MDVCGCNAHVEVSEQLTAVGFSFHRVGFWDWSKTSRLNRRRLHPQSHPPALDGSSVRLAALTLISRIIYILPSLEDWFGATFWLEEAETCGQISAHRWVWRMNEQGTNYLSSANLKTNPPKGDSAPLTQPLSPCSYLPQQLMATWCDREHGVSRQKALTGCTAHLP